MIMMIKRYSMGFYYVSDELYHHGVKGMKWGVRKDPRATASSRVANEGGTMKRK